MAKVQNHNKTEVLEDDDEKIRPRPGMQLTIDVKP